MDPMKVYYQKGEIKEGYYNPRDLFEEVHLVSFCDNDIEPGLVRQVAGNARLYIHAVGRPDPFNILSFPGKIVRLLKEIGPDVVRAYDISLRGALACYASKKLGIPSVISLHIHFDDQRRYDKRLILKFRKFLEAYSLTRCDTVICVTDYLKRYAEGCGAKKAILNFNRVDLGRFSIPRMKKEAASPLTVLSVGRLEEQKNQECLIRAVKDLDIKLILIGNGPLYPHLKDIVKELAIEDKVEFILSVPHKDIHNYYHRADIFALSTHYEGFCIPVVEAMAASLPIVASDIPPISEIMGGAGVLVENRPADFAATIKRLMDNAELRDELAARARERARTFDSDNLEENEAEIYRKAICR